MIFSIGSRPAAATPAPTPTPAHTPAVPGVSSPWQNPAAAAALRTSAELLRGIENGITQNFGDIGRVRRFSSDLRSTNDILDSATLALTGDGIRENDQFLPLVQRATGSVVTVERRLDSKEIAGTWPLERSDLLAQIRQARLLSENVAQSLA